MSIILKPYKEAVPLIQSALQKTLAEKPVLLLLSGGSAAELYREMTASLELVFSPGRLKISLVDERWDEDPRHADANDLAIHQTGLVDKLESLGAEYFPVLTGASLSETAAAFDARLSDLLPKHAVVTVLGIGTDGHTAGILPDADAAAFNQRFDSTALAVGYKADDKFAGRITTTFPLLRQARHSFLVAGSPQKETILKRLLNPEEELLNNFPAKIMFEMNDVVVLGTLSEEDLL